MKKFVSTALMFIATFICYAQVVVYPSPVSGFSKQSPVYQVSVTQGGVSRNSFVYESAKPANCPAKQCGDRGSAINNFHFTVFSFQSPVTVKVTKMGSSATLAAVLPGKLGIGSLKSTKTGGNSEVSFVLQKPAKVSVEFNDDPQNHDVMMVFADPLEKASDVPDTAASNVMIVSNSTSSISIPNDKTIVYFKRGVYQVDRVTLPSTVSQVYVAGGSYIKGCFF